MRLPNGRSLKFGDRSWHSLFTAKEHSHSTRSRGTNQLAEAHPIGLNPGQLRMWTYIPPNLPSGSPLVVVLHGCGQTASAYVSGAGWLDLADRFGFALLAPEQVSQNNVNGCFNWFRREDTTRGDGEAGSIKQMIDTVLSGHSLDANRVFITGLSAGGAMTSVMLATYPATFAGGAIIAGLPYGAATGLFDALRAMQRPASRSPRDWGEAVRRASSHAGPWPKISIWHGDADPTVSPSNADALIHQWTDVLDIARPSAFEELINGYLRRAWLDGNGGVVLESYTITGMGHGTPILSGTSSESCGSPGPFILSAGISSSMRISEFWGLKEITAAPHEPASQKPRLTTSQPPHRLSVSMRSSNDSGRADRSNSSIGKVISDALRAAGLLK